MALLLTAIISVILLGALLLRLYSQSLKLKKLVFSTELQLLKESQHQQSLVAELSTLKEKFARDILYDALTELPSRRLFEDRLAQTFNQSKRYQLNFAVMFLDIDEFKVVNDALGYEMGDQLLKEVANRIKDSLRQVDSLSRFSSDEFVIIATQLSKPETAAYVAQRLLDSISLPFKIKDQDIYITASIGIATFPSDGNTDPMSILKNATNALHQAKCRRNCYQFYRSQMHVLSKRELMLNSGLQNEHIFSELQICYQPQIDFEKKKIVSAQAILYWEHPDFGRMTLSEFLRQAENNGRIVAIGDWLIQAVVRQYCDWQKNKIAVETISIGVSPRQLEHPHFAYKLSQLFQQEKIDPSIIMLEISETNLTNKLDVIEKVFHMIKHLGVQITIKDFGVGALSLQYLKKFPIDRLKIANSIVESITVNKDNEAIVKMAIAIAKSLQISIAAEGIESQKQVRLLKNLGCNILQGNLFSTPIPAEQITKEKISSILSD